MKHHGFPPDLKPEQAPISMLIRRICHAHDFAVRSKLERVNVTMAFGPVFRILHHRDGLTQSELAHALNFRPSSVSVTLQQMADLELIEKRQCDDDARNVYIYLTERGRSLEKQIKKTFDELDAELVSPLTPQERTQLQKLLIKMHNYQLNGRNYERKD